MHLLDHVRRIALGGEARLRLEDRRCPVVQLPSEKSLRLISPRQMAAQSRQKPRKRSGESLV
jgi:hypothetical protein